ncbi:MAG: PAS domain S-box protein [Acidobacteriota bacterium]|nr:MAG: PAS domain S-box protein [Acidobacteriota bacterium]
MSFSDQIKIPANGVPVTPSDPLFRIFVENLPVMFYAIKPTPPHKPLYISPSFERFGYPIEEWLTDANIWDRVIHEDDKERVLTATRSAMREGRSIDFEYRVHCKNGSVMWVRDRSCLIANRDGSPLCWQGVILDITERKKAEHELAIREKLYRTLARSIPKTAVLLFDREHRYTLAEGEQLAKHDWKTAMFEDRTLEDVFPEEIVAEWSGYYDRALAGEDITFETEDDGNYYLINIRPVRDEKGEIFAGMVMWKDISERRRAELAVAESEARFRELFDNANDIIYVHDLEGNYISINKAGERIFGYTSEEALALNMSEVVAPEHLNRVRKYLRDKIDGKKTQTTYEVECIKKDGSRAVLEINSSVIRSDGKPIAVQGIARDITDRKLAEDAISKSEERYRDLFENANDLIYTHDMSGNFTSLNRAGEIITGYSREEALKMNIGQVVAPEFLELAQTMTARKVEEELPTTYELEIIARSGKRVTLELSTRLIVSPGGSPIGVQGIARDITDRRRTEIDLHNTISLFASTFESTADGIVVMSLDREIVTCNRKFREMWDVHPQIIEKKDGAKLVDLVLSKIKNPEEFNRSLDRVYADPLATASDIIELTDGRVFERYSQPQMMEGRPVGRVACFRDITERTRAEEKIRYYAVHDTLTNLPNRVEFMNQLRQAVKRGEGNEFAKFAVLFLDLDRFKVINDSLGHAVGDKLLIAIAERLTECVRPGDIVARLGGDEFTILLNRSGDAHDVARVAERLQAKISEPFKIDNYEVFTTASIGIVIASPMKRSAEDFLRDADAAMYRAKEAGKARYEIFDQEMHVRNMNLLQVENDLRRAVERHEFEVLYQPIVELATGRVCEFEALIRWRHPVHGLVAPNEFVHVAEETGLIIPIGRWILEESCRQIGDWQRRFKVPLAVSVNLSAKQLMHPNLTTQVQLILEDSAIKAEQLKLEVTESTVMEHSEKSLKVLQELDRLGVALSTDDFGTGYSSLSYLQKFPFERLKIDRSFIHLMDKDEKSGAIVKTILMLGENLGIEVVAEGVETASQLEKLRSLGCKAGQGYLFSRPVDRETAEQFLLSGANAYKDNPALTFRPENSVIEVADVQ